LATVTQVRNRTDLPVIVLAYLSFIVLGLPSNMLGLAWLSMQENFSLPLDGITPLLFANTAGYMISSFLSGRTIYRFGFSRVMAFSVTLSLIGALGFVLSPTWPMLLLAGLLMNLGGGSIDAGMNTYFTAHDGSRLMNWLHGCFGIGAFLGPAIMTALLAAGQSWRMGYVVVVIVNLFMLVGFLATLRQWRRPDITSGEKVEKSGLSRTLLLPAVWISVLLFVLAVSLEFLPGQWTPSLFTEARGMSVSLAGQLVTIYLASFTVGRFLFGFVGDRLKPMTALRLCFALSVAGAVLVWWNGSTPVNLVGMIILGFAQAPIFPLLITTTPERVGHEHAANAIGFQVSAAGVGVALLPGLAGTLATQLGLEVIGLFLVIISILMVVLHEIMIWRRPSAQKIAQASTDAA
jgi:fucose permease